MDLMIDHVYSKPFDIEKLEKDIVLAAYDVSEAYYTDPERLKMRMDKLAEVLRKLRVRKYEA